MMQPLRQLILAAALAAAVPAQAADAVPLPADPLAPFSTAFAKAVRPASDTDSWTTLFRAVMQRLERSYATDASVAPLVEAAVKALEPLPAGAGEAPAVFKTAMAAALSLLDPYTKYLDAREYRAQTTSMSGSYVGLGMQVDMAGGLVRVVSTTEGSPAARAGLSSGDLISRIGEKPVTGLSLSDAIALMRGDPGTPVTLVLRRAGQDVPVSLMREAINRPSVRWNFEDDVLVLRLTLFSETSAASIRTAIDDATAQRLPVALVFDLRGNPGGRLDQAIRIADEFLTAGNITTLRGRGRNAGRTWVADPGERLAGVPMVVLVDGGSASASELVAAALQDNGRATVMGSRSFGKGSVQVVIPLGPEKGALRMTTALYLAPSGRVVQRGGIAPDIELASAKEKAASREADRDHALPGAELTAEPKARVDPANCAPTPNSKDPGIACAVAYLRAKTLEAFVVSVDPLAFP